MEEKDFSKSIKLTFIILFGASLFWFLFACQLIWAYDPGGSPLDLKKNSRMNDTILMMPGTGTSGGSDTARFRTYYGTQACVGVGSNGYILSGTLTGLPFIDYLYGNGSSTINFSGFTTVAVEGSAIPSAGSVNGKIDAVAGTGTTNVFTDTTLAGQGTLTATVRANGVDISPTEVGYLDGVTSNIQTQITTATGSITNHTHTGSDGTTQIAHDNVTGTGANSHATIDNFISSKAAASGLASLDGSSKVVQDPANATSTPTAAKIPISLGTGKLDDSWLSNNITKLGTPTTDNISEGSTNKYYTDSRVDAVIGSSSIHDLSDVGAVAEGDFLKKIGGIIVGGSNTVSVTWGDITGVPASNGSVSATGASGKIPVGNTSGYLDPSWIDNTIISIPGTTTAITGTSSSGRWYNLAFGQSYAGFGTLTTSSLVSYYKLEDENDSFGTNHLTNYNSVTYVSGKYNNAATFNGTTQYLQKAAPLSTSVTNISMFMWVYIPTTSEKGCFAHNGHDTTGVSDGYSIGVGDSSSFDNTGNILVGLCPNVTWMPFGTSIGTGWHHVGMTRDGTTWRGYIDAVQAGTTHTTTPLTPENHFTIGANLPSSGAPEAWNNKIDDVVFYDKCLSSAEIIELYNNTGNTGDVYLYHKTQYIPAGTTTALLLLQDAGTTTNSTYMMANVDTLIVGAGTTTAITGTTTAYSGWFTGAARATAFNVASTEKIKENIKPIKIKPDLLDAESDAKKNYIASNKSAWIAANQVNYTTLVNETGTGTVTIVDNETMESDYNNYIELEWASDLNQDAYTENIQKGYEKVFWQTFDSITPKSWTPKDKPNLTRKGFIVEEVPDVVKGDDMQSIDPMALIAYMTRANQSLKADIIFTLSTLKELITTGTVTQQRIDHCNDRLEVLVP